VVDGESMEPDPQELVRKKINGVLEEAGDKMSVLCQEFAAAGDYLGVDRTITQIRGLRASKITCYSLPQVGDTHPGSTLQD